MILCVLCGHSFPVLRDGRAPGGSLQCGMTIEVPDSELGTLRLTPERARIELAVGLYAGRQVSLGRAARVAGIPYADFLHEIGRRSICIHYTVEDAEHDMKMADALAGKSSQP